MVVEVMRRQEEAVCAKAVSLAKQDQVGQLR